MDNKVRVNFKDKKNFKEEISISNIIRNINYNSDCYNIFIHCKYKCKKLDGYVYI